MIKKAKVEDDEYKTEEQTYYRYVLYEVYMNNIFNFILIYNLIIFIVLHIPFMKSSLNRHLFL